MNAIIDSVSIEHNRGSARRVTLELTLYETVGDGSQGSPADFVSQLRPGAALTGALAIVPPVTAPPQNRPNRAYRFD